MLLYASPQSEASGRQRCGILRQAHFITSSEKGGVNLDRIGKLVTDNESELTRSQEGSPLGQPERQRIVVESGLMVLLTRDYCP